MVPVPINERPTLRYGSWSGPIPNEAKSEPFRGSTRSGNLVYAS